jgi:hypothetical protein
MDKVIRRKSKDSDGGGGFIEWRRGNDSPRKTDRLEGGGFP